MPDEQDTPMPEPSPEDANEASEPQAADSQEDAQQPEPAESTGPTEATAEAAETPSEEAAPPSEAEAAALAAAMAAVSQVQGVADSAMENPDAAAPSPGSVGGPSSDAQPFTAPELSDSSPGGSPNQVALLSDVHMDVRIELGRTRMFVEDVLKLGDGAVVELDKLAGDPVDVFVNDRRVARGEVLVLNDMFCVRINEIVDITQSDD